jgi:hypothetical protein
MTYGEVIDTIQAFTKNNLNILKEKALMDYKLAELIAANVAPMLSSEGVKVPSMLEAYEFLFPEEKKKQDEINAEREMEIWKQRMINFAEHHNEMRKRGETN